MDCPQQNESAAELMLAYAAGTLDPKTKIALERHLATCAGCREMAAGQKAVWEALDTWVSIPLSVDFDARLYRKISQEASLPWWRRPLRVEWSRVFRPGVPVAAACAALMLAFLIQEPLPTVSKAPAQQKVLIEQVERALDDMDMLKKISVPAVAERHTPERL